MAVYTQVSAEALIRFLTCYDLGELVSAKGIAEGVENSNYLVETTRGRYFLTLYERRVAAADLPWFLDLMTHLADKGLPVPRPIADRAGIALQTLEGRPACLIEYLPGVSVSEPTPAIARAAGDALGRMHVALADFARPRDNPLGLDGWHGLADACRARADEIAPGLAAEIDAELAWLDARWPHALPRSVTHSDLFPDNLLLLGERVTGLIDFYFACTDLRAYDLAVMHGAWSFAPDGTGFRTDVAGALVAGYAAAQPLSPAERAALPTLCRGASLRFMLTRSYDWLNTPADALVTRKDPLAYRRRLAFYRDAGDAPFAAA